MKQDETKKAPKQFHDFEDYLKLPRKPSKWLIEGLIPVGYTNIFAAPKVGKALALDTPILTTTGWSTMGKLRVNDYVYGSSGRPVRVVGVSPTWRNRLTYKVAFLDGSSVVADVEHEWEVREKKRAKTVSVLTTGELIARGLTSKSANYRKYKWDVRLAEALQFPEQTLPMDPYCFGMWLGDGTRSNSQYTSADPELIDAWRHAGFTVTKQPSNQYGYGIKRLKFLLADMGVLNNKHVPDIYMFSSVAQRRALLQGLMDTDGTATEKGNASFANTSQRLAEAVLWLAQSLGYRARLSRRIMQVNAQDYIFYVVSVLAHEPVFRLQRKLQRQCINTTERYRSIKSIVMAKPQATVCIEVDAPDHLFLAGTGLVPTHNSFVALGIAEAIVCGDKNYFHFPVHVEGPVAFLQVDTPREEWGDRYSEQERFKRLSKRKHPFVTADMWTVPSFPFNLFRTPKEVQQLDATAVHPQGDGEWLRSELERIKPVLLIVDTLRDIHGMDEDKSGDMIRVLNHLMGIVGPDTSILILSHSRKDNERTTYSEDDIMQSGRGSNSLVGKMDMVIRMTKKELHTKGRARGYKKYAISQVPEGEPDEGRVLFDVEKDSEQAALHKTLQEMSDSQPGISKNQLALKLAAKMKLSERTAYRRIDEWQRQIKSASTPEVAERVSRLERELDQMAREVDLWDQPLKKTRRM